MFQIINILREQFFIISELEHHHSNPTQSSLDQMLGSLAGFGWSLLEVVEMLERVEMTLKWQNNNGW